MQKNKEGKEELMVTGHACLEVLKEVDPAKTEKRCDEYVKRGFGLEKPTAKGKKGSAFSYDSSIAVEDFMKHLAMNVVKSSTKRDDLSSFGDLQEHDDG